MAQLHHHIDDAGISCLWRMTVAATVGDTTELWLLITVCAESACIASLGLKGKKAKAMTGRARVEIRSNDTEAKPPREAPAGSQTRTLHNQAGSLIAQARRLGHMASRSKTSVDSSTNIDARIILAHGNLRTHAALLAGASNGIAKEIEFLDAARHINYAGATILLYLRTC
jgi:hypothetical protein